MSDTIYCCRFGQRGQSSRVRSSVSRAAERTLAVCPASGSGSPAARARRRLVLYVETVQSGNLLFFSGMLSVVDHKPGYLGRGMFEVAEYRIFSATFRCLSTFKLVNGRTHVQSKGGATMGM